MNTTLALDTLKEINSGSTSFTLDRLNNDHRKETLLILSTLIDALSYDSTKKTLYFKSFLMKDKAQEMELLQQTVSLMQHMAQHLGKTSYEDLEFVKETTWTQQITPWFRRRYQVEIPRQLTVSERQNTPNLLTLTSRVHDREKLSNEFTLDNVGIPKRDYGTISLRERDLHIFEVHGRRNTAFGEIQMPTVTAQGGDLLLVSCYQATETAQTLIADLHEDRTSTDTGIIHLKEKEPIISKSCEDASGVLLFGMSKLDDNTTLENPFLRTSLEDSKILSPVPRHYTSVRGNRISLQRSPSANRLYLGTTPDFFENRTQTLNKVAKEKLEALKYEASENMAHLYEISIDFSKISPKLNEKILSKIIDSFTTDADFKSFFRNFVNPFSFEVDYHKLNALLTHPEAYTAQQQPGQAFVPLMERACIWENTVQRTPSIAQSFESAMTSAGIDRRPQTHNHLAQNTNPKTNATRKISPSF